MVKAAGATGALFGIDPVAVLAERDPYTRAVRLAATLAEMRSRHPDAAPEGTTEGIEDPEVVGYGD